MVCYHKSVKDGANNITLTPKRRERRKLLLFCCTENETDRPVLFDNKMEAPAGSSASKRSIYLPGVQEVRQAERSGAGASRGATPELPGIRVVSVESGLTLPDLSRKNAPSSFGRPLTDRHCAGTKNVEEGRKRRWILARTGTTENRGHSDGMTA